MNRFNRPLIKPWLGPDHNNKRLFDQPVLHGLADDLAKGAVRAEPPRNCLPLNEPDNLVPSAVRGKWWFDPVSSAHFWGVLATRRDAAIPRRWLIPVRQQAAGGSVKRRAAVEMGTKAGRLAS
jgi:hypothetical protein